MGVQDLSITDVTQIMDEVDAVVGKLITLVLAWEVAGLVRLPASSCPHHQGELSSIGWASSPLVQ